MHAPISLGLMKFARPIKILELDFEFGHRNVRMNGMKKILSLGL